MQQRMLSGTYECALDNRHRLAIPSKVREPFVDAGAAISYWFDDCLVLAPRLEWPRIVTGVFGEMNLLDDDKRQLWRFFTGSTADQETLDRQGRVAVPERLHSYAGIDGKVSVVGAGDYLEIWNPQRLEENTEAVRREGVSTLGKRIVERAA